MENKDEQLLIDYLYGEMSQEEKGAFEDRLVNESDLKAQLEGMKGTQELLSKAEEEEVVIPSFIIPEQEARGVNYWQSSAFRWSASIAASLILILLAGFALDFRVQQNGNAMTFSFGQAQEEKPDVSQDEVRQWIAEAVNEQAEWTQQELTSLESDMMARVDQSEKSQKAVLNIALSKQKSKTDELLELYVAQLNEGNKQMIEDFFVVNNRTQKEYMNNVLADFNQFYQSQRSYDLEVIQASMGMMENNYSTRQSEQENLLASLYDLVKTQSK